MCRNCAGLDDEHDDVWAAAFASRDAKAAARPAAAGNRKPAPAPEPKPASRDQNHV